MKNIKSIAAAFYIGIAIFGITTTSAQAVLMEKDLNAPLDKLITLDTDTGLEWLDVDATLGLSYNQAVGSIFVISQGFRHANSSEFTQLLLNAGFTNTTGGVSTDAADAAAYNLLSALVGITINVPGSQVTASAWLDGGPNENNVRIGFYAMYPPFDVGLGDRYQTFSGQCCDTKDYAVSHRGNWLVRSATPDSAAIPEPGALALFGLGLAGLGFARRRKAA